MSFVLTEAPKEEVEMAIQVSSGQERIAALCEAFPLIPRSIIIKADVFREGLRYTKDLENAGEVSFPHSLIWNPKHRWNPQEAPQAGEFITIPWKFDLSDETPVVVRFSAHTPYEIRRSDGRYHLLRDGEVIDEVSFEPKTEWLFKTTSKGVLMTSVFLSWTRECLLGCALRYCEYTKTGDQCVYCCLDSNLKEYQKAGIKYDLSVDPQAAAETYQAAYEEVGQIRSVAFTGGSLRNTRKEAEHYVALYSALSRVREKLKAKTDFGACLTPPPELELQRLKEAGLDHIAPNMDCWEEKLWPVIVPGKHKFVGRKYWIDTLFKCVKVWGRGNVGTALVVGPEMVPPHGFKSLEEGVESWRRCFEWLLSNDIGPFTVQWEREVNSPWENAEAPPTEYFLMVAQARHEAYEKYGAYDWRQHGHYKHAYYKAAAWTTDNDFRRLVHRCSCEECR